jgi:hypothetical protein
MNKNIFMGIEPDYEQITEREASDILAMAMAKLDGAAGGADTATLADSRTEPTDGKVLRFTRAGRGAEKPSARRGRLGRGGRIAAIAIAAVLACSAVAFATGAIGFDSPLLAMLIHSGNMATEEKLSGSELEIAQGIGTAINKSVTEDGITVTAKKAIGDRNNVYLLFDVTTANGKFEKGNGLYYFKKSDLDIDGYDGAMSETLAGGEPDENGVMHFAKAVNVDAGARVQGKTVTFKLSKLYREPANIDEIIASVATEKDTVENVVNGNGVTGNASAGNEIAGSVAAGNGTIRSVTAGNGTIEDANDGSAESGIVLEDYYTTISDAEWELSFRLDYKDSTVDLGIERDIVVDGDSYRLSDVLISPLGLSFRVGGEKIAEHFQKTDQGAAKNNDDNDVSEKFIWLPITVTMDDGSTSEKLLNNTQTTLDIGTTNPRFEMYYKHNSIIDPSRIESIAIGDNVLKIK